MKDTETLFHNGNLIRLEGVVHAHMCTRPIGQPVMEQGEFHRAVLVEARGEPIMRSLQPGLFENALVEGDEIPLDVLGLTEEDAIRHIVHRRDVSDHHMEEADLGLL